ncbi:MAG: hypothetical protein GY866_14195 [Proteobacteria bacterium]|nr:hypothetical protein [Pseudomonadota bacterium]
MMYYNKRFSVTAFDGGRIVISVRPGSVVAISANDIARVRPQKNVPVASRDQGEVAGFSCGKWKF